MIKIVITDFSRVLLFPSDENYKDGLNKLNNKLIAENPNYDFADYFRINDELLEFYSQLNESIPVYVFTSETIQEHPSIKDSVENSCSGVLSALKLGIHKSDKEAFEKILKIISVTPKEVIYIGDKQSNLDVAAQAGIETLLNTDNQSVISRLDAMTKQSK